MDCSLPGSFVHGIFQARVLEWGAIASAEGGLGVKEKPFQLFEQRGFNKLSGLVGFWRTEKAILGGHWD